jgi:hypothetical protein
VRAWSTPRHAAEVVDWPRQLRDLIADANRVLSPSLHVRLELVDAEPWSPPGGDDDLDQLMTALVAHDPGTDVDRVVALVGSLPRYEPSASR